MDLIYIMVCVSISYWLGCFMGKYDYRRKIEDVIKNMKKFNVINGLDALEDYIKTNGYRHSR